MLFDPFGYQLGGQIARAPWRERFPEQMDAGPVEI
jgi:hypothetical protein